MERMVDFAHRFLAETLAAGDRAVDLTAGRGRDTLFLAEQVLPGGELFAFDIQRDALAQTENLLRSHGFAVGGGDGSRGGIALIEAGHEKLASYVEGPLRAAIANLGYLPGGDPGVTTHAQTTLTALQAVLALLAPGGRLAVVGYVGHAGGCSETEAVAALFAGLESRDWTTMRIAMLNRVSAPVLLMAERRR